MAVPAPACVDFAVFPTADVAYSLDPPVSTLVKLSVPCGPDILLMLLALVATSLLFTLPLYPLVADQTTLLVTQLPAAVATARKFAAHEFILLQTRFGPNFVRGKKGVGERSGRIDWCNQRHGDTLRHWWRVYLV